MIRKHLAVICVALAGTVGLAADQAGALTLSGLTCSISSVEGSTACAGIYNGNDKNQDLSGLFGESSWTRVVDYDQGPSGPQTENGITLTVNASTWSVDTYNNNSPVMFVLKGGNSFSAFLMDTSLPVLARAWDRQSMMKGNGERGADLSHWGIYSAGANPPHVAPVPLPAAGWMLLAAIGGMAFWRRRATA